MSTRIRLQRGGAHKRPFYRLVVADQRAPRDGRYIERIGSYDPLKTEAKSDIRVDRARYWLEQGAWPSDRARKLLVQHGFAFAERRRGGQKRFTAPEIPAVIPSTLPPAVKTTESAAEKPATAG